MLKYYSQFIGKTIAGIVQDALDKRIYGLVLNDKTVLWIMSDPEGNGPGFLEITKKED